MRAHYPLPPRREGKKKEKKEKEGKNNDGGRKTRIRTNSASFDAGHLKQEKRGNGGGQILVSVAWKCLPLLLLANGPSISTLLLIFHHLESS